MANVVIERCKTGVPGFDELCEGGLVAGSVNAIFGGPGAGKSTFLYQFLYNGVTKFNENGLFVSFEPDIMDVFMDGLVYGMDFPKLDKDGSISFLKMSPKASVKDMKDSLMKLISKNDIKRVAIDPVSVLTMFFDSESDVRETIFELVSLLKRMKVTVMMADETIDGSVDNGDHEGDTRTQSIKFLSDCLVIFYSSGLGGASDRALRISKMRRTDHVRGPVPFKITGNGIKVLGTRGN